MTEEMTRLKNISEAKEQLSLPEFISPGPDGDAAHAAVVRMCSTAIANSAGLRVSRSLHPAMAVVAIVAKRIATGTKGRDQSRVQVAEEVALALAEMQFVAAYWLLYLVPHTFQWPSSVERHAREIQAHLSALRSLCRGLLERVRTGPEPEGGNRGEDWREVRARNRLRALRERDEIIAREERCVICMVHTQPNAEDGPEYLPMPCKRCGVKRHNGCAWLCTRNTVCGLCRQANILRRDVSNNSMAAVHQHLLEFPGATPFWIPNPIGTVGLQEELARQTTSLHEAARHGRYELLSMLLHHCRGRGLMPGACLVPDGYGEKGLVCSPVWPTPANALREYRTPMKGWDDNTQTCGVRSAGVIELQRSVDVRACVRICVFVGTPVGNQPEQERSAFHLDLSVFAATGGAKHQQAPPAAHPPRFVDTDCDSPLSLHYGHGSHTFTYVNRVVEGYGASFNWRLCHCEMPDRIPAACHHKEPDDNGGHGGSGSGGLGAPTGLGGGGWLAAVAVPGGAGGLSTQGTGGCDAMKCGHQYLLEIMVLIAVGYVPPGLLVYLQMGVTAPLQAFKTATKGWGVKAMGTIQEGEYICSYAGEMISESVYQAREPEYELRDRRAKSGGACYCFNIYTDTKSPEGSIVVDADRYRGVAALFNHSCCGANVKVRKLVANNTDKREPIHGFFALKKIVVREGMPGPELVFNYGASEKPKPCLCSACTAFELSKRSDAPARLR
ncbi:unnamed protein product [Pylaiella littoralis]